MKEGTKEFFEKLYQENDIERHKKHYSNRSIKMLIAFGVFVLSVGVYGPMFLIGLPILLIYVSTISSQKALQKEKEKYMEIEKIYKEKIVAPILKYNIENIQYFPSEGITLDEYKKAEYIDRNIESVNCYSSEDHMIMPLTIDGSEKVKIDIYDVKIRRKYRDHKGRNHEEVIHEGLITSVNLSKNINAKIKLQLKYNLFGDEVFETQNVRLDMTEFERYFDVYCEDKILVTRIFTSEIMGKLLDVFKTKHHRFDINILDDKLYVRVHKYAFFEPFGTMNRTDYQRLEEDFLALEEVEELAKMMYIILENMEI